jgi:hypothetical protein
MHLRECGLSVLTLSAIERLRAAEHADAVRESMPMPVPRGWEAVDTNVKDDMTEEERSIMAEFWLLGREPEGELEYLDANDDDCPICGGMELTSCTCN